MPKLSNVEGLGLNGIDNPEDPGEEFSETSESDDPTGSEEEEPTEPDEPTDPEPEDPTSPDHDDPTADPPSGDPKRDGSDDPTHDDPGGPDLPAGSEYDFPDATEVELAGIEAIATDAMGARAPQTKVIFQEYGSAPSALWRFTLSSFRRSLQTRGETLSATESALVDDTAMIDLLREFERRRDQFASEPESLELETYLNRLQNGLEEFQSAFEQAFTERTGKSLKEGLTGPEVATYAVLQGLMGGSAGEVARQIREIAKDRVAPDPDPLTVPVARLRRFQKPRRATETWRRDAETLREEARQTGEKKFWRSERDAAIDAVKRAAKADQEAKDAFKLLSKSFDEGFSPKLDALLDLIERDPFSDRLGDRVWEITEIIDSYRLKIEQVRRESDGQNDVSRAMDGLRDALAAIAESVAQRTDEVTRPGSWTEAQENLFSIGQEHGYTKPVAGEVPLIITTAQRAAKHYRDDLAQFWEDARSDFSSYFKAFGTESHPEMIWVKGDKKLERLLDQWTAQRNEFLKPGGKYKGLRLSRIIESEIRSKITAIEAEFERVRDADLWTDISNNHRIELVSDLIAIARELQEQSKLIETGEPFEEPSLLEPIDGRLEKIQTPTLDKPSRLQPHRVDLPTLKTQARRARSLSEFWRTERDNIRRDLKKRASSDKEEQKAVKELEKSMDGGLSDKLDFAELMLQNSDDPKTVADAVRKASEVLFDYLLAASVAMRESTLTGRVTDLMDRLSAIAAVLQEDVRRFETSQLMDEDL